MRGAGAGASERASTRGHDDRSALVVFHEEEAGGATRAVLRVLPALRDLGWSFSFWAPGPGPLQTELRDRGLRVAGQRRELRYSLEALRSDPGPARRLASVPRYLRAFRSWVEHEDPAVVLANTRLTIPEAVAARGDRRAVVMHVHEIFHRSTRDIAAAGLMRASTDAVVAPSAATAEPLRRLRIPAVVVPYGVEIPKRPVDAGRGQAPLVVGTLGTVSDRKGTDVFLDAVRELRRSGAAAEVEFRIVGPCPQGPEAPRGRELIARAEREGVVHKVVSDPYRELAEWDVFVLPTREDPFPLAVLEAMASGLPVVASRVDGVPEQLADDTGILVAVDDVVGFSAAIGELVGSPARRAELGEAARRRVESTFTFERQAADLDAVFAGALRAKLGGARRGRSSVP